MSDILAIEDLEFWTHIGATEEERAAEQRVLVSVELHIDTKTAGESDDLAGTIDYEAVRRDVLSLRGTHRRVIERLAEDIAAMILRKYTPTRVTVTIRKFPLPGVRSVSITITRP